MPVYEIHGTEKEAGITTSLPIQARSEADAIHKAHRLGIVEAHVVGLHGQPDDLTEESIDMSANELVDKTGPSIQPRIVIGWVLLLCILPAYISLVAWMGGMLSLPANITIVIEVLGMLAIAMAAVQVFRRFW